MCYPTTWLMQHKIMTALTTREAQHRLSGDVQIGDTHLGDERNGGKPGRGSEKEMRIVAAVSLDESGNPPYAKVTPVPSLSNESISTWANANLKPGCSLLSDGLGCFAAVTDAGYTHRFEVVGQRRPRDLPKFKWINAVLCNLKTMLSDACTASGCAKHADR